MRFRKKPVIIEAQQWFPGREVAGVEISLTGHVYVMTIHGQAAYLSPGDWVITEPDGIHHYPCKPNIFEATYDPVADDEGTVET